MNERAVTKQKEAIKATFLEALKANYGVITKALRAMTDPPTRQTIKRWRDEDPEFNEAVEAVSELVLDFAEDMLFTKMKEGDTTAIIFFLKTRGKKRGYTEKSELDVNVTKREITVTF